MSQGLNGQQGPPRIELPTNNQKENPWITSYATKIHRDKNKLGRRIGDSPLLHDAQNHNTLLLTVGKVNISSSSKSYIYCFWWEQKLKRRNYKPIIRTSRSEPAWTYSGFNFNHFPLLSLGSHFEPRSFKTMPSALKLMTNDSMHKKLTTSKT